MILYIDVYDVELNVVIYISNVCLFSVANYLALLSCGQKYGEPSETWTCD